LLFYEVFTTPPASEHLKPQCQIAYFGQDIPRRQGLCPISRENPAETGTNKLLQDKTPPEQASELS
jgi:hypothetical protein